MGNVDWQTLHKETRSGFQTPAAERERIDDLCGLGASAYGEILPESAGLLLRWMAPGPRDVLYDIGSGTGKLLLQAAATTAVGRAVGIELAPSRHASALQTRRRLRAATRGNRSATSPADRIVLHCADFRDIDLSDATIVYAGSTCFPEELMDDLACQLCEAERLRLILSTRPLPHPWEDEFPLVAKLRLAMSWGPRVAVFVHRTRPHGSPAR